MWIATTVLLAVAVPAMWVQQNLISQTGYAALAQRAAADPALQSWPTNWPHKSTASAPRVDPTLVQRHRRHPAPPVRHSRVNSGQANAFAHRWLFPTPSTPTSTHAAAG